MGVSKKRKEDAVPGRSNGTCDGGLDAKDGSVQVDGAHGWGKEGSGEEGEAGTIS